MATKEEIALLESMLGTCRPGELFLKLNEADNGLGAVLRILHRSEGPVTSGTVSRAMGVSTARVAALLKRLENLGLVARAQGRKDARTTMVSLTRKGTETVERMYADYCGELAKLIDRVGLDRLREFMAIAGEIDAVMKGPPELDVEEQK